MLKNSTRSIPFSTVVSGGPDSFFSMKKANSRKLVRAMREAEKAVGVVSYELTEKQKKGRVFSRSLYVVQDIKKGELITEENVRSIRPGFGMHPKHLKEILGKPAKTDVEMGTPFWQQYSSTS